MTREFDENSTTDEVLEGVDLSGKRVLVTGVSAGLGLETARALISHGANVVGAVRDLEKAARVTADIAPAHGGGSLTLVELDLASLASVRACADGLIADGRPFDAVINNAGIMACPKARTTDGFESQFGTNHLGHFVLANRIASLLSPGARLVSLSSGGHRFADVDLDDPNFEERPYTPFTAYGQSKTANILFAVEFDRRHKSRGIRAVAVHPGSIPTELPRHMTQDAFAEYAELSKCFPQLTQMKVKTVPQGAATSVWAAFVADPGEAGGRYCEDCHVAPVVDRASHARDGVRSYALDGDRARLLWAKSEEMVGETF